MNTTTNPALAEKVVFYQSWSREILSWVIMLIIIPTTVQLVCYLTDRDFVQFGRPLLPHRLAAQRIISWLLSLVPHTGISIPLCGYDLAVYSPWLPNTCPETVELIGEGALELWPCQRDKLYAWWMRTTIEDLDLKRLRSIWTVQHFLAFGVVLLVYYPLHPYYWKWVDDVVARIANDTKPDLKHCTDRHDMCEKEEEGRMCEDLEEICTGSEDQV